LGKEEPSQARQVAMVPVAAEAEGERLPRVVVADLRDLPTAVDELFRGAEGGADPRLGLRSERDAEGAGREGPEEEELGREAVVAGRGLEAEAVLQGLLPHQGPEPWSEEEGARPDPGEV